MSPSPQLRISRLPRSSNPIPVVHSDNSCISSSAEQTEAFSLNRVQKNRIWRLAQGSFNILLSGWPDDGPLVLLSLFTWLSPKRELHAKPLWRANRHRTHRRHLIILLFKLLTNPLRLSVLAPSARDRQVGYASRLSSPPANAGKPLLFRL